MGPGSFTAARAKPKHAFNSSTSPNTSTPKTFFRTRCPPKSPVSPESPVHRDTFLWRRGTQLRLGQSPARTG